ncbi:Ig-like domain-containing protein [Paenibacillus chartarius]|uniref:Ig-like domain-containing protein n=1 Tax=Paenibacillus chartarius TaxID=747481 RepID=A0ABV6DMA5_9BACL
MRNALNNNNPVVLQRGDAVSDLTVKTLEDLNKVSQNINGLVSNIANEAIKLNKTDSAELSRLIDNANLDIQKTEQKIDLNKPAIDRNAGVDPAQQQQKQAEKDRMDRIAQQTLQNRTQQQLQLNDFIKKVQEQIRDQKKSNKEAEAKIVQSAAQSVNNPTKPPAQQNPQQDTNTNSGSDGGGTIVLDKPTELTANDRSLSISGKAMAGKTIKIEKLSGTSYVAVASGPVGTNGSYNVSASELIPAGTTLRAYVTDGSNNSAALEAVVKAKAPEGITAGSNYVQGQAGAGSTIVVKNVSGDIIAQGTTGLNGQFNVSWTTDLWGQKLNVYVTSADNTAHPVVEVTTQNQSSVTLVKTDRTDGFDVAVKLDGLSNVYGVELHFLSDEMRDSGTGNPYGTPVRNVDKFPDAQSVEVIKYAQGTVNGATKLETIYAVTKFNAGSTVSFTNDQLVKIPFNVTTSDPVHFKLEYVLIVDQAGNAIPVAQQNNTSFTYTK